jgi:hypothetical protein
MRFSTRLSVVAAPAIAGLVPAVTAAAVSLPHARPATSVAGITSGTAPLWAERFKGAEGNTAGFADAVSPDGSTVYVTGSTGVNLPHPHTSGATVAYNSATGAVLWQTQYNTLNFRNFSFNDIAVNPDGSAVYATGEVTGSHHPGIINAVTAAYNASTGTLIWAKTIKGGNINNKIAVSPDGATVFMADGANTVAYSATTGKVLWAHTGGGLAEESPNGSAVFVCGAGKGVAAYDPMTGAVLWAAPLTGFAGSSGLAVSHDGSKVFVTGFGSGPPHSGQLYYRTAAFDAATGARIWAKNFTKQNYVGEGAAVTVSPNGSKVFVTGSLIGPIPNTGWGTVAYDATTGAQLWVVHFHQRAQNIAGTAIAVSPDGSKVFVAGITTAKSGDGEIGTAAYDATTGALLWIGSYSPAGYSGIGRSIAISPDGSKVFTVGAIWPGIDNNNPNTMVTAAYSS